MKEEEWNAFFKSKNFLERQLIAASVSTLGPKETKKLFDAVQLMSNDLICLGNNLQVKVRDLNFLNDTFNIIQTYALREILTNKRRRLFNEFLLLTWNWNQNVAKSKALELKIKDCRTLLETYGSLSGLIRQLKRILNELQKATYLPPAFELSKAYLKTLEETLKKQKSRKKCKSS